MKLLRMLTRLEVEKLTGIPKGTMQVLRSYQLPRHDGRQMVYHPTQALALLVARGLRKHNVSTEAAGKIMNWLWTMPAEELEHNFAKGYGCLMVVGTNCQAILQPLDIVLATLEDHQQDLKDAGVSGVAVDVERLWKLLQSEIAKLPTKIVLRQRDGSYRRETNAN